MNVAARLVIDYCAAGPAVEVASLEGVCQSDIDVATFLANFANKIARNVATSIPRLICQADFSCK